MVFSLFGRKGGAPKKAEKKPSPAKAPPATPVASPAKPESAGDAEADSLDFSAYVPPPKSEPRLPESAPPPPAQAAPAAPASQAQAAVPSSSPGNAEAEQFAAAVLSLAPVARVSVSPAPAPGKAATGAADPVDPVIEEPAILFANGQVEEALAKLLPSVRKADSGPSTLQQWLMLLDLYQHLGKRVEFEALSLEFVVKFERSPPAWLEGERREDPALATGGIGHCALSGMLSGASAPALEKLRGSAGTLHTVQIDCSKLEGLDGPGCRLFRETLLSIRGDGKEIVLTGGDRLTRLLEDSCQPGMIETDGALWALLLEVYRTLGLKDKFEEAAVNYAVTFEVSPPSWESPGGAVPKSAPHSPGVESKDETLVLSGEITGASEALAARLQQWAEAKKMLSIDMLQVRRVDFVSAGLMLRVFSKLQPAGILVQISGANELIHALFRVMGIDRLARIIPRR